MGPSCVSVAVGAEADVSWCCIWLWIWLQLCATHSSPCQNSLCLDIFVQEHQAGVVRCWDSYSCKGSGGGAVGFLGNSGLGFVIVRVMCTRVQCLDICVTNQDILRLFVFHGFYNLLLFNYRLIRKCRVNPAQLWNSQCWNHFMQAQTKSRLKILWFLAHLLI